MMIPMDLQNIGAVQQQNDNQALLNILQQQIAALQSKVNKKRKATNPLQPLNPFTQY